IIFRLLPKEKAARVFSYLPAAEQRQLLEALSNDQVRRLLDEMTPDDRTRLLEEMPAEVTRELLLKLDPRELEAARKLLGYPENTAGRYMTPEYAWIYPDMTAARALAKIREPWQGNTQLGLRDRCRRQAGGGCPPGESGPRQRRHPGSGDRRSRAGVGSSHGRS